MKYNFSQKRAPFPKSFIIILILIIYVIIVLFLPAPTLKPTSNDLSVSNNSSKALSWPSDQQEAIGAQGFGVLATNGEQKSAPIASIAKTMLALSVLKEKPLEKGSQGPIITITQEDLDFYTAAFKQNGSVVPVRLNEGLTEYQMLQALLLPSGDNIADTLAVWAFGSVNNYLDYSNKLAASLGLTKTHFADASGLSPQTVSSASDLVVLGDNVMQNPVLAEIVAQQQVTLPVAGTVKNYNTLLGQANIVGIKTGNTDEAGGCFLFAANETIDGKPVVVIGAVMGAATRTQALADTKAFLQTNINNLQFVTAASAGQTVGVYNAPWGTKYNIVAKDDVDVLVAGNAKVTVKVNLQDLKGVKKKGTVVGEITANSGAGQTKVDAVLATNIGHPPFFWKLLHP